MKRELILTALLTMNLSVLGVAAPKRWQGSVPKVASNAQGWKDLLEMLRRRKLSYGAMAGAHRMLLLFPDVEMKELAYRTLISLVDAGYPYRLHSDFANADIEPSDSYDFINSYYLYKGIANADAGTPRWSKYYLEKVDKENFAKFHFFSALQSYAARDLDGAEATLKKILLRPGKGTQPSLISKVARTLARIYFEREQYERSFDVYRSFLLKLNPMTPSDWLESAWNLYHLKRYEEALGHLLNLDAMSSWKFSNLERYVLRALIYRDMCATNQIKALSGTFEQNYRGVIEGIKSGEDLKRFPVLRTLSVGKRGYYVQLNAIYNALFQESQQVKSLGDLAALAGHLYDSELASLSTDIQLYEEESLRLAASYLMNLYESIKFLGFDVAREIYNPDRVFQQAREISSKSPLMQDTENDRFQLRWEQVGTFWRDERLTFRSTLKNACIDTQAQ